MMTLGVVAQVGSFTAAATRLHLTQSAVSQQIAALEKWAGVPLLRRRPVELTEAGRLVVSRHKQLFSHIGQLNTELAQLREGWLGSVHVGAFLSACRMVVPQAFAAYAREHPRIVLRMSQMEPGPALAALDRGDLDVAIVFSYGEPLPLPTTLHDVIIFDEPVLLAMPDQHPLAGRTQVDMTDIDLRELVPASDAWVYPPPPDTGGFRYFGDDFAVVLALVAAERGVALVPGLAVTPTPGVTLRPLSGDELPRRRLIAVTAGTDDQRIPVTQLIRELRRAGLAAAERIERLHQDP